MERGFWLKKWDDNQIHFHSEDFHPFLEKHVAQHVKNNLSQNLSANVLVPLCGKSLDMIWLNQQGCSTLGIELSQKAIKDFWRENNLEPKKTELEDFEKCQKDSMTLLCGDFFNFNKVISLQELGNIDFIYDRASVIALPPDMRKKYFNLMTELTSEGAKWFLITLEYDQEKVSGPPFSVTQEEIKEFTHQGFRLELLEQVEIPPISGKFQEAGIDKIFQKIYLLERK